jgi:hypothetical protein
MDAVCASTVTKRERTVMLARRILMAPGDRFRKIEGSGQPGHAMRVTVSITALASHTPQDAPSLSQAVK